VFSSSRAEVLAADTCIVISGMAISGSNDIGKVLYVTSPIMKQAVKAINTAIGRWIKNFIMFFYLSINSTNHSSLTR
jgi:hypothetical protein